MEPITLIVTALTAGAKTIASEAVKDSYRGLLNLIKQKFQGKPTAELVLAEHEKKPEDWEKPLKTQLIEVGADKNQEIINLAKNLMELIKSENGTDGKYNIKVENAYGSAIGNQAQVTNNNMNIKEGNNDQQ